MSLCRKCGGEGHSSVRVEFPGGIWQDFVLCYDCTCDFVGSMKKKGV